MSFVKPEDLCLGIIQGWDVNVGLRYSQKALDGLRHGGVMRAGKNNRYPTVRGKVPAQL